MQNQVKKILVIPLIIFMVMIGIDINSLAKGLQQHETWRAIAAAGSLGIFITLSIFALIKLTRFNKKTTN